MGWIEEACKEQEKAYARLNQANERNAYSIHLKGAPGWLYVKTEYTCGEDAVYPRDPAVVKAIKKWAPDLVPIWVRYVYREPTDWGTGGQVHVIGRHGLACFNDAPGFEPAEFPGSGGALPSLPLHGSPRQPNQLEYIFKGQEDPRAKDLPGAYVPFDWDVYRFVRENYRNHDFKGLKKHYIDDPLKRYQDAQRRDLIEKGYALRDIRKYATKKFESVSDNELRDYFMSIGRRMAKTKPTVVVPAVPTKE